jgi:hypothetical protein
MGDEINEIMYNSKLYGYLTNHRWRLKIVEYYCKHCIYREPDDYCSLHKKTGASSYFSCGRLTLGNSPNVLLPDKAYTTKNAHVEVPIPSKDNANQINLLHK